MLQFNSILDINDGPQQRIAKGKEGGLVGGASGRGCYHSKEPNLKSPNVKPKAKAVNSIFWISDR